MTVEVRKVINAPVDKVFKAWTDPDQISKWFLSCESTADTRIEQDVRTGGQYRIDSIGSENKNVSMTGTYQEVIPNKKLVFSWTNNSQDAPAKDTLVTVEFIAKGDGTEVILKHTNFVDQATAERHNMGWTRLLENLANLFA